jgi:hypothetical protein
MAEKTHCLYNDTEILDQRLVAEIGNSYVVLVAGGGGKISGLEYYTTEDDLEETMNDISHQSSLLKKNYSETKLFYHLPETVLVPVGQFNTSVASEFVDLAFGSKASSRVNVENINIAPGIVNVYRSNENWQEIIGRHFRAVTKRHLFSKLVEQAIAGSEQLRAIFYKDSFILVAVKNKQLKFIRSFEFCSDADVLYHILNVCKQVDIDAVTATLQICGFIGKDSSTFQVLRKYLGTIKTDNASYDALPAEQQEQYPHHYFTSFINLLS